MIPLEDNSQEGQGSGEKAGKGAYIKVGTITAVEDFSNYPNAEGSNKVYGKNGFEPELCLVVKFKTDDFDRQVTLFGKYKRNKDQGIKGWDPWNNTVQRLLYKILGSEAMINDDFSIPQRVLEFLVGKEFKFVNYISSNTYIDKDGNTQYSYQIWSRLFNVNQTQEEIETEWIAQQPYTKDYAPELVGERKSTKEKVDTAFPYGANEKPKAEVGPDGKVSLFNDDLI